MSESDSSGCYASSTDQSNPIRKHAKISLPHDDSGETSNLMSRTASLPNIYHPKSLEIGFESDFSHPGTESSSKQSSPGSIPISSGDLRRHQSQNVLGAPPPKPPRDPSKLSAASSTTAIPLAGRQQAVPKGKTSMIRQNTTLFIWKDPPSATNGKDNKPDEKKQVVVRNRRKDPQKHARRHTLQGGIDASMVRIGFP